MGYQHVDRQYSQYAASYDSRWAFYNHATLSATLSRIRLTGSEKVLDVGCGTGELERMLIAQWPGLQIVGIDLCKDMLDRARTKFSGHRNVAFHVGEGENLPLADGKFDLVLCCNAFHYFRNPEQTLAEFHRVLQPGGGCVLTDWCDDYLTCKVCNLFLRVFDRAHFRMYGLDDCVQFFKDSAFVVEDYQRFKINWLWGLMTVTARKR